MEVRMKTMLYQDSLVELSYDTITFNRYYFPFGRKKLSVANIDTIRISKYNGPSRIWRLWGTGDFLHWFPLDWKRPQRDALFVLKQKNKWGRIAFTVENSALFEEAIKKLPINLAYYP